MGADKRVMRAELRAARAAADARMGPAGAAASSAALLEVAHRSGVLGAGSRTVTGYVASPGEPDLAAIRVAVRQAGGRVLLPVPLPGRILGWALDDGSYAWQGRLPVQVPTGPVLGSGGAFLVAQQVDVVLVPALAIDRSGGRLGQGGGFYDRLIGELAATGASIRLVAVVWPGEVLPAGAVPREAHDALVAEVLTTEGLLRL